MEIRRRRWTLGSVAYVLAASHAWSQAVPIPGAAETGSSLPVLQPPRFPQELWARLRPMLQNAEVPDSATAIEEMLGIRFTSVVTEQEKRDLGASRFYQANVVVPGLGQVEMGLYLWPTRSLLGVSWSRASAPCLELGDVVRDLDQAGWAPMSPRPDYPGHHGWNFGTKALSLAYRERRIATEIGKVPSVTLWSPTQYSSCVVGVNISKLKTIDSLIRASGRTSRMQFVNEIVPPEDVEKYGLRQVNEEFLVDSTTLEWTIDRAADVYLRWMGYNWQDPGEQKFSFWWKGHLLRITLRVENARGVRGGDGFVRWGLPAAAIHGRLPLPLDLEGRRAEIIRDLKAALTAFRSAGKRTSYVSFTADFGF